MPTHPVPKLVVSLPNEGEALISMETFAAAQEIHVSTAWANAASDPDFPPLRRITSRCTRMLLSDARTYIAKRIGGNAKATPNPNKKHR